MVASYTKARSAPFHELCALIHQLRTAKANAARTTCASSVEQNVTLYTHNFIYVYEVSNNAQS